MIKQNTFSSYAQLNILNMARALRATSYKDGDMKPLNSDFTPGRADVICARGRKAHDHEGNKVLRKMIDEQIDTYAKAKSKLEKSIIVSSIVTAVREASPHGGFVREGSNGTWYEVGDHIAREKVGQR